MPKSVSDILPSLMQTVALQGEETEILRLRKGKIERGAFKGTRKQRFVGWLVRHFRGTKYKAAYLKRKSEDYKEINDQESYDLALALKKDLSKRSPRAYEIVMQRDLGERVRQPHEIRGQVTVKEAKELLEHSAGDRAKFDQLVQKVVSPILNPPQTASDPTQGATSAVSRAVNQQFLCRDIQVSQLRLEVGKMLRSHDVKETKIERLDRMLDDEAIKVSLFATARDYATRLYAPRTGDHWRKHIEPSEEQLTGWQEKRNLSNEQSRALLKKKSATELATELIIKNEAGPLPDGQRLKGTARIKHIQRLRKMPHPWAAEAARLYERDDATDDHKAMIVEREGKENDARRKLQNKRRNAQDNLKSGNPFRRIGANRRLHDLEKQLEESDQHLLVKKFPLSKEEKPHAASNHSNYPNRHSEMVKEKVMEHHPLVWSDTAMEKDDAIAKTVELMMTKYPSFQESQYEYLMDELRDHLSQYLSDRAVMAIQPQAHTKVEDNDQQQGHLQNDDEKNQ